MHELYTMTALELRSFCGINKFLHTKDKAEKKRYSALLFAVAIVVLVVFFYIGALVYGLSYLGLSSVVAAYLVFIASLIVFAFGIFRAGGVLFTHNGYDILASMPIKTHSIVLSRFAVMYFEDVLISAVIVLPGAVMYGILNHPNIAFYLVAAVSLLFIPAIPGIISACLGTFIMALSSGAKHKSIIQTVLMLVSVVGILLFSFSLSSIQGEITEEVLKDLASTVTELFSKIYIPAIWMGNAMLGVDMLGFVVYLFLSVASVLLFLLLTSKIFHRVMQALRVSYTKNNYKIGKLEARTMLKTLYIREAKRYFSSSIYVTNTIIGPIMACIMSIAVCVAGLDTITAALPMQIPVKYLVPFALSAVFCMMTTTSTAISMEGRQIDTVKALPIPTKALLDSKILLNLSIILPFYIVSELCLAIAIKPNFFELVFLIAVPFAIILFSVVLGITVNLKLHRFDWEREEQIVKQSASSAIGGFAGFFLSVILGIPLLLLPLEAISYIIAAICVLLLVMTSVLYNKNNKAKLELL